MSAFGTGQFEQRMGFGRAGLGDGPVVPAAPTAAEARAEDMALAETGTTEPSIFIGLGALGVAALGGALTGYIASGDRRGALAGAGVHTALVGLGATIAGVGRLEAWKVIVYGLVSVGGAVGAGYLFMRRRRGRRS